MTSFCASSLVFRLCTPSDVARCAELEAASFPPDEAASREKIAFRCSVASSFFLLALDGDEVVAFANGTLSAGNHLRQETMAKHDAAGTLLCLHSLVVDCGWRRKGIALRLLSEYLRRLPPSVREVRLLAKASLSPLYSRAGFRLVGQSDVQHGKDRWDEWAFKAGNS